MLHGIIINNNNNNNIKGIGPATTETEHKSSHSLFILIRFLVTHQLSSRSSSSSPYAVGIEGPIVDQQVEEERHWLGTPTCVIQFSLDLVSLFSLIYIVVSSTPTTTIFSIYFLMQPSGGGKQNEEGVLWFHQWTTLSIESVWKAPFKNIQRKRIGENHLQYLLFISI